MDMDTEILIERGQLRHKILKRAGTVLVAIILAGGVLSGIVFAITSSGKKTSSSEHDVPGTTDCTSQSCLLAASRILNATDMSVDPCKDFYQFACGKWIENHPNYYGITGIFHDMQIKILDKLKDLLEVPTEVNELEAFKKAKYYYQACMDEEKMNLTQILATLEDLGGWPVLGSAAGGNWEQQLHNTMDLLTDVFVKAGMVPIVNVRAGKNVLVFSEPRTAMPDREYYLQARNDSNLKAYENYAVEMAKALGADEQTAISDMRNMVDLEIDLAKIMKNKHGVGKTVETTLPELSKEIYQFEWEPFLTKLFGKVGITLHFTSSLFDYYTATNVVVYEANYYRSLSRTLSSYSNRTVANYVIWRCIRSWVPFLPKKLRDLQFDYGKTITGATLPTPRWTVCAELTQKYLPEVMGRMYVDAYFNETFVPVMTAFVHSLRTTFKSEMDSMTWMDWSTRFSAVEKLDAMTLKVGYPQILKNDSYLDETTSQLTIGSQNPFINNQNVMHSLARKALEAFQVESNNRNNWTKSPADFNAYNDFRSNSFIFPAAIIEPPFFGEGMPKHMLYGGLGSIVGHEMTHGFDTKGRYYDSTGSFNDWWSAPSELNFNERVKCLVDQYNHFMEPQTGIHLDGNYTSGENIADNGGIKESYAAYRNWVNIHGEEGKLPGLKYTTDQLFFISAAQVWCATVTPQMAELLIRTSVHSLTQFRVIGMLQNSIEFANAFNCPSGSYMNPRNKCILW